MNNRNILIRFDDICPTMNWEQWEKAKLAMDNAGVTALIGVIPDCQDPDLQIDKPREDFWEYIKDLQDHGYTIAMHGYQHKFFLKANGLVTKNKISEFAGLPYETQLEKIRKGKDILNNNGIVTDVFFAPAHSYDNNTLRALSVCGFKYVSDGVSSRPYVINGITLLPCRAGGIPRIKKRNKYVTAVVHAHEWERNEKQDEWVKFCGLLDNFKDEIVNFSSYSNQEVGLHIIQRTIEKLFLFYRHVVSPFSIKIKSLFKKLS